jgi:hypothetical protein
MRTFNYIRSLLAFSLTITGILADGPCDAWSDDCREMEQGSACLAAFVTRGSVSDVLRCVGPDEATATRIVSRAALPMNKRSSIPVH